MSETEALEVLLLAGPMEVRGRCAYTMRLAQRLADCDISPLLVTSDLRRVDAPTRARLRCREYRGLETPLVGCVVRWALLRDLKKSPPALIHIQSRRALALGSWLARRLERPFVLTIHDYPSPYERLWIDRRWCKRIIALSQSVRDDLIERQHYPAELVNLIPAGIDVAPQVECPAVLDPGHLPVIGTAGPLEAVKGVPYFLSAAQQVLAVRPDLEFLVAGAGPEEANLRRVAHGLGIEGKVTFVPYVNDFVEALAAMDIFCLPSLQQGLGTIMLQAMALGRPVIATQVGGVADSVHDGRTGLIVPPKDSGALAGRILELLDDPARARAIGTAAREFVLEEFDVVRMVLRTAELYREIDACQPKLSPSAPN